VIFAAPTVASRPSLQPLRQRGGVPNLQTAFGGVGQVLGVGLAAICSAVAGFAPPRNSSWATSRCPCRTAASSAVIPQAVLDRLIPAPRASSNLTTSACPERAAPTSALARAAGENSSLTSSEWRSSSLP